MRYHSFRELALNNTFFQFLKADSPELLKEIFHLRYQIYCHECYFLNPDDYPDGLETDQYDSHSIHFAALDHENTLVGTIRLIMNAEPTPFPIDVYCKPIIKNHHLIRSNIAEISRLAVSKKYRRQEDDNLIGMGSYLNREGSGRNVLELKDYRRRRPEIVLGLYRIMYHESKRRHLTHWYAAMEKKLWGVLNRIGIQFHPVGEEVDYYGPVVPYFRSISEIEENIYQVNPRLYCDYFLKGLEPRYWPEFLRIDQFGRIGRKIHGY